MDRKEKTKYSLFNAAIKLEYENKLKKAVNAYQNIINTYPRFKPALENIASLYSRLERYNEALSSYKKLSDLGDDYLTFYNIGRIHYKQHNYKDAVLALEKSKGINGKYVVTILLLALCYGRMKNIKAAKICFRDVLKIDNKNEAALNALAILLYEEKDYNGVLNCIEKILIINPKNKDIRKLKVKILSSMDRFPESAEELKIISSQDNAYQLYNKLVSKAPEGLYLDKYGEIDNKIGKLKDKIAKSDKPDDFISLSLCCLLKGDTDEAIDYLFKAKQLTRTEK